MGEEFAGEMWNLWQTSLRPKQHKEGNDESTQRGGGDG